jgi:hypothetical protein
MPETKADSVQTFSSRQPSDRIEKAPSRSPISAMIFWGQVLEAILFVAINKVLNNMFDILGSLRLLKLKLV